MIQSFRDKETKKIWNQETSRKYAYGIQRIALRKLIMINRAKNLNDSKIPPANRLEKLKGNRSGQFSMRINDKYRICFEWINSNAWYVEIADYHS